MIKLKLDNKMNTITEYPIVCVCVCVYIYIYI
jgi:hypothetical protein